MDPFYTTTQESGNFLLTFYHSGFFTALRFFLGIYTIVLIIDIILLIIVIGMGGNLRTLRYGADLPPAHRGEVYKKWKKILRHMKSSKASEHKIAVLEADMIVDDILTKSSFIGANMREKIEQAHKMQIENKERLLWAHDIRNKIVKDSDFSVTKEQVQEVIEVYETFLRNWQAL